MRRPLLVIPLVAALLAGAAPAGAKELVLGASVCGPAGCRPLVPPAVLPRLGAALMQGVAGTAPQDPPPLGAFYRVRTRPGTGDGPLFVLPDGRLARMGMYWFRLPAPVARAIRAATDGLPPFRPAHPRAWIGARRVADPRPEVALLTLTAPATHHFDLGTLRQLDIRVAFDRATPWTDGPQFPMLAYLPRAHVVLRDGLRWMAVPAPLARRIAADAGQAPAGTGAGSSAGWRTPALIAAVAAALGGAALLARRRGGLRGRTVP
jgi:hypothetical protein